MVIMFKCHHLHWGTVFVLISIGAIWYKLKSSELMYGLMMVSSRHTLNWTYLKFTVDSQHGRGCLERFQVMKLSELTQQWLSAVTFDWLHLLSLPFVYKKWQRRSPLCLWWITLSLISKHYQHRIWGTNCSAHLMPLTFKIKRPILDSIQTPFHCICFFAFIQKPNPSIVPNLNSSPVGILFRVAEANFGLLLYA